MQFSVHVHKRHIEKTPLCTRQQLSHAYARKPPPTASQNIHAPPRLLWHALTLPQPQADLSTVDYTVHVITWKYDKHAF